jgi:hypothetical protein
MSSNSNITMDIIEKYPNKNFDWTKVSNNSNITMYIIEKYPDKKWDLI